MDSLKFSNSLSKLLKYTQIETFLDEQWLQNQIQILPVKKSHVVQITLLPFHHRDPFDRMITAQSVIEELPVLTADRHFAQYDIEILW